MNRRTLLRLLVTFDIGYKSLYLLTYLLSYVFRALLLAPLHMV